MNPFPRSIHRSIMTTAILGLVAIWTSPVAIAGPSQLVAAIREKEPLTVLQELRSGTNPNHADGAGNFPLMTAIQGGDFEITKFLLWHGANVIGPNGRRLTADSIQRLKAAPKTHLHLLLRTYAFLGEHGRTVNRVKNPSLCVVFEPTVDYTHPEIAPYYHVNRAELNGQPGRDDDGNGFVDDVYGWAPRTDKPFVVTELQQRFFHENRDDLKTKITLYNTARTRGSGERPPPEFSKLGGTFSNPLATIFGETEATTDLAFVKQLVDLSHGTHVAGTVVKASGNVARVQCLSWGLFGNQVDWDELTIPRTKSFPEVVRAIQGELQARYLKGGRRGSDYLASVGPGVVNASMGKNRAAYASQARVIVNRFVKSLEGDDVEDQVKGWVEQLAAELYYYASMPFLIVAAEHPETLFVVAAGNEDEDVDDTLVSPAYLSRFFPNVITIAAHGKNPKEPTGFTNFGRKSVNLGAPGVNILAPGFGVGEVSMDGTSMAAPAVAGLAAQIRSKHPQLDARNLRRLLENSGQWVPVWQKHTTSGRYLDPARAQKVAAGDLPALAEVAFSLALRADQKADPETLWDALDYSKKTIASSSANSEVWRKRAAVLDLAGNPSAALEAIERAVALNESGGDNWKSKGIILARLGKRVEALAAYDRMVEILSSNSQTRPQDLAAALVTRARHLISMDRKTDARKDLANAREKGGFDAIPSDLRSYLE